MEVALLAEGVDRNITELHSISNADVSPSSRRAWIEIEDHPATLPADLVALLAEGVDRNKTDMML